ncbi:MAG: hypothetical protein ACRYGI_11665 [Janthinobacterium lividum]
MKHETPEQIVAALKDEDVAAVFHLAGKRLHEMKHPDAPVTVHTLDTTSGGHGGQEPPVTGG